MLALSLLLATVTTTIPAPLTTAQPTTAPIVRCLSAMNGAVYNGDPSDRKLMQSNITACTDALRLVGRMQPSVDEGPAKLYLTARLLDRAATLSFMGLGDAGTALREVRRANLYFRIVAGLAPTSTELAAAAGANVQLTAVQLQTLRTDIAARRSMPFATIALRSRHAGAAKP